MSNIGNWDLFRGTERSELLNELIEPRQRCPEYRVCSGFGECTPVWCETRGEMHEHFTQWVNDLMNLSDVRQQFELRKALRTMRNGRTLQSCVMLSIFIVAKDEIDDEDKLQQAEKYDDVRGAANAHLVRASAELKQLRMNIQQFDYLRPELATLQDFTSYKQALCELVDSGLEALAEIYDREAKFASNDVLELVSKASLRQRKDEFLHESSRVRDPITRRWGELAILLEAGKAIIRAREAIVRVGKATLERPDLGRVHTSEALR
jgi:hypothetical protein